VGIFDRPVEERASDLRGVLTSRGAFSGFITLVMERDLERRMLHRASGYRSIVDVGPIILQREIPFRCGSDLVVLFEMMALSTLAETKLTKNYRLCRVSEESLAIYNGIPRDWHTLWKITRTRRRTARATGGR